MEVLTNIGFDWQVAVANFISFLIIFWILKKFTFGPIGKIIKERKEIIKEGIDKSQQSETELLVAQQKAGEFIKNAKAEANQIVADAKETGDEQVEHAKNTAKKEADTIISNANVTIQKNKVQMEKDLFEKTAGLVALGVQKILEEDVDQSKNQKLNKRALDILNKK